MNEENDLIRQIENFKRRIKIKGLLHQSLLRYLGISVDENDELTKGDEKSDELYRNLKENNIPSNKCEFREFLETISHLLEIHQLKRAIKQKSESLLIYLKEDMNKIFSENEILTIFNTFKNNFVLLILVENNIVSVETIVKYSANKNKDINYLNTIKFFYPEIRKHDGKYFNELMIQEDNIRYGLKHFVEKNDQNLDFFYEIRKGRNEEPKLIDLIREDNIGEFISFIEHHPIDLYETIQKEETIFEAYTKKLSPFEYSAFFGATAIFKYLYMKEANINRKYFNNIFECAVHGRNYEIIHLLEERKEMNDVLSNQNYQLRYLGSSIKMHYNEIFEYIITNYNIQITGEIIKLIINFRNYHLLDQLIERNIIEFKDKTVITDIFYGICQNGNEELVKILINHPNLDINSKNEIFHH